MSTRKVHEFVLVRVVACLLFFLFISFGRTQWLQPLHRTKKTGDIDCLVVYFFISLCFRLFICLVACLFVCLILFPFVSFLVSLLFDDRCSDKCQNIDEDFDNNREFYKFLCVPFKPTTFGVSFPEVLMIADVFKLQKHQMLSFFSKSDKKIVALRHKKKDVTR